MRDNNFLAPLLVGNSYQLNVISKQDSHIDILYALHLKGFEIGSQLELPNDYCLIEVVNENELAILKLSTICEQDYFIVNFEETED
jgi:hypothetical protein